MNIRIAQCTFTIRKLSEERNNLEEELYLKVDNNKNALQKHIQTYYNHIFNSVKDTQRRKFNRMKDH